RNLPDVCLVPAGRAVVGSFDDIDREHEELWATPAVVLGSGFPTESVPSVEGDEDHEVRVEVLDREPSVVISRPSTLDLDTALPVPVRVERDEVVARMSGVRLERLDPFHQQKSQNKKLRALRLQRRVLSRHPVNPNLGARRVCPTSRNPHNLDAV